MGEAPAVAMAELLRALSDPLRLRMLAAIAGDARGESCVCDLAQLAEVSQPTVSHHLRVLREAGILLSERRGTWVWYRIAPAKRRAVSALLDEFAPAAVSGNDDPAPEQSAQLSALDTRIERLAEELADETAHLERTQVTAVVRESYAGLVRAAKLTPQLVPLTERFARQRLADLTRTRGSGTPQVLFVCVQNAGRSQLAAAITESLTGGGVRARSAGSHPAAEIHPGVRKLLEEIAGPDAPVNAFPKPLTDDAVRASDVVVTMGCGDVCPVIPGVRYEDWTVGDPALASAAGILAIRDDIEVRVRDLLARMSSPSNASEVRS